MQLCVRHGAPPRLVAHLTLVHDSAVKLIAFVDSIAMGLIDLELALFGAATHDLGKVRHPKELQASGALHEAAGRKLLQDAGVEPRRARFAETHARWEVGEAAVEDLIVALADKVWKGKRDEDLELALARAVAALAGLDPWDVFAQLGERLDELTKDAPRRLDWQTQFGLDIPPATPKTS